MVVVIPVSAAEIPPGAGSVDIVPQLERSSAGNSNKMEKNLNLKIFLVDDDPFSLEMNRQQLANLGYAQVITFSDGQTCLNNLVSEPDVVIVDHNMAPMNGLDLLKKIKWRRPPMGGHAWCLGHSLAGMRRVPLEWVSIVKLRFIGCTDHAPRVPFAIR